MRLWCDFGGLTPKNADATQEKLIFRPMRDLFAGPIICMLGPKTNLGTSDLFIVRTPPLLKIVTEQGGGGSDYK